MTNLIHWIEEVFRWVLETTWQTAVLVGLILLAQWLLRRRLAPTWRYGLWLLLVVRLLMPAAPPSSFSIFNLAKSDLSNSGVDAWQPARMVGSSLHPPINNFAANPRTDPTPTKESRLYPLNPGISSSALVIGPNPTSRIDWLKVSCFGWLVGVLFLVSRLVYADARLRSRIERHRPVTDENVTQLFDECRREFKITRPMRIIESADVESPGVYGFWQKCLLLPEGVFERFSREELRHTFLHELAHIKRCDLEVNWLTVFLQILHWFNPVIWLAFARMRAERELAADALVLLHVSATDKVAYGETIIKVAANLAQRGMQPGLVGIAESKADLQERVRAIARAGAAKYWTWAAACVVAIVGGMGLTNARQTDPSEEAANSKTSPANHPAQICGTVVDSQRRPVDNVQIAVYRLSPTTFFDGSPLEPSSGLKLTGAPIPHIFNPAFGHPMADLPRATEPWNYCTTDEKGRFFLNDLDRALCLVAVSERGFRWIAPNEFSTNMTVTLEPWGRIEGTLWHNDEVLTNEPVAVVFEDEAGIPSWQESVYNTNTDAHGRFSFDFVPPGHFGIHNDRMSDRVTVKSGQTAVIKLGGPGRPLVGKIKTRNPNWEIETTNGLPCGAYFTTIAFHRSIQPKTIEEFKAWRNQPIRENEFTNCHVRPVQFAKDGSFRIDPVEPGKYALTVHASAKDTTNTWWLTGWREVEIPASDPKTHEPLDLGIIEVSLSSGITQ